MATDQPIETEGLRQRNVPVQAQSSEQARQTVLQLNALEEKTGKDDADKKTFGRTPDGTVFTVPETQDMVSQLLSPSEPKNMSDLLVLTILACMISLLWTLPNAARIPVFGAIFVFWRASYNVGIGWLLQAQSKQNTLVRWARKSKLFGKPEDTDNPKLRAFIKSELEKKVAQDYAFDDAPLEYNTWLVFRRIVDLILMCDFVSYMLFALACAGRPDGEFVLTTLARWTVGLALLVFNIWVKLDAHRVVKDYAWYWGDFFFLVDQDLTFDGVFEMAPHPMYSIGYIGYYGISLMAASQKVMFISIFAHAAQFAFLVLVENPHIEKTYNSPPPRQQLHEIPQNAGERPRTPRSDTAASWPNAGSNMPPATHNLLGPQNFDFYRVTDSSTIVIQVLVLLLTVVTPRTTSYRAVFFTSAVVCRVWYSVGIGYLLNRQSTKKKWTRHFLKHGESTGEAWRQWKGTYHMSMILCYATFAAAAWKMYTPPAAWDDSLVVLKHTIGLCLVTLQMWVAFSIYEQLGEFGWFFGDFFFDHSPKLTYGGIYRFLNNPERVLGLAGVWGVALIVNSKAMFCLALLSHTLSLLFIQLVERPHMQKLYGRHLRQDSGLVRSIKRSLPPPLRQWQDGLDKMIGEALDTVEQFLDAARPQLGASISNVVEPTKQLLSQYPARMVVTRVDPDVAGLDPADYAIEIEGESSQSGMKSADESHILRIDYGTPIKVKWTAPINHAKLDWIGLYMLSRNSSKDITQVPSQGRWIATNLGEYDVLASERGLVTSDVRVTKTRSSGEQAEYMTGEMLFAGDKLFWEQGVFEFRYHHNGKHNVMTISEPFEVQIQRYKDEDNELVESPGHSLSATHNEEIIRQALERALLPVIRNCFERDPEIAPTTPQETFGGMVERDGKFSRRAVYAIQHMFGIEFAPQVVKADGKVENLAWRIWEAEKALAPFSMSKSRGTSTPVE